MNIDPIFDYENQAATIHNYTTYSYLNWEVSMKKLSVWVFF